METGNRCFTGNTTLARHCLLCTAQFLVVLDVTIVAVALPAIAVARDAPENLQWVSPRIR